MHFSFLTVVLIGAAVWYGWRAWSGTQSGVIEARVLPLPGLRVQRIERARQPEAFRRVIAMFVGCAAVCIVLVVLQVSGVLQGMGARP